MKSKLFVTYLFFLVLSFEMVLFSQTEVKNTYEVDLNQPQAWQQAEILIGNGKTIGLISSSDSEEVFFIYDEEKNFVVKAKKDPSNRESQNLPSRHLSLQERGQDISE